jgi:hypothetical protein
MKNKFIVALAVVALLFGQVGYAQKGGSKASGGGSKASGGGSKASGGGSKASGGGSKASGGGSTATGSQKYSSGSSSSSKPATPPATGSQKYSSGSSLSSKPATPPATGSQKYSSGSSTNSSLPPTSSIGNATSQKPSSNSSAKANANKQESSQRSYVETKKASNPPVATYTSTSGKPVNVRTDSPITSSIRNQPSSYYTPVQRTQRTDVHIHNYGYSHPSSWYYGQPSFYVGGGYSSAFWFMMSEWSAERRALWLYNNQHTIEQSAYERGMQDQAVAAEIARLKSENKTIDPDYVDSEFASNPDLMYDQEHVEAVYNPVIEHKPVLVAKKQSSSWFWVTVFVVFVIGLMIVITTQLRIGR